MKALAPLVKISAKGHFLYSDHFMDLLSARLGATLNLNHHHECDDEQSPPPQPTPIEFVSAGFVR